MGHAARPTSAGGAGQNAPVQPYVEFDRAAWRALRDATPLLLSQGDLDRLAGLGDRIDLAEVEDIYLPLSRLIDLYVGAVRGLHSSTSAFLRDGTRQTPFVIGIGGSVAVGKSTTSRLLRQLISSWPRTPSVDLITTDGFLLPNAELERRGLLHRKGFPDSYDRSALFNFVRRVKSGAEEVAAPVYSHLTYDIVPGEHIRVRRPDVLIIEGLNVLQPSPYLRGTAWRPGSVMALSDLFDFSIYVHARASHIRRWYIERFLRLRETAFADPGSYFHRYALLEDAEARATAERLWSQINEPNLVENIRPTRDRARVVLIKGPDHAVSQVRLRRI